MKRYDIGLGVGHGGFQFDESADGDWVLWADVQQLIKENIVLRAEVKTWRDCVSPSDAVTTRMQACVEDAIAATDAAGALEES